MENNLNNNRALVGLVREVTEVAPVEVVPLNKPPPTKTILTGPVTHPLEVVLPLVPLELVQGVDLQEVVVVVEDRRPMQLRPRHMERST